MNDFRLTARQIAKLKETHRDKRFADRIKAIVSLSSGWSVAEVLLIDAATVRNWLAKYRQGGVEELLTLNDHGKEPSLTVEQQEELAQHLDENIDLDSNAIRHHIEVTYGVQYSPSGVKELLHRLDFVDKKPKHVPGKLDPEKQAAFIAAYAKLRKNHGKNDPIDFGDGCHPQFNSIPAFGWIRRGSDRNIRLLMRNSKQTPHYERVE
ncbi:MAG: winged helix-turn-helix domain-containing protein [Planctomycetaceae bacterium]|nr:winged helix-turn-helix domain-containing protein [Planctomycetaceae bacterium]